MPDDDDDDLLKQCYCNVDVKDVVILMMKDKLNLKSVKLPRSGLVLQTRKIFLHMACSPCSNKSPL